MPFTVDDIEPDVKPEPKTDKRKNNGKRQPRCPNTTCNAFIKSHWIGCPSCGAELRPPSQQPAPTPKPPPQQPAPKPNKFKRGLVEFLGFEVDDG